MTRPTVLGGGGWGRRVLTRHAWVSSLQKNMEKSVYPQAHFWISQNLLSFGRSGASKNFSTKSGFFLSHKQKPPRKLTSPNIAKNTQIIACWYITYIRQIKKKEKKGRNSFGRLQSSELVLFVQVE